MAPSLIKEMKNKRVHSALADGDTRERLGQ